MAPARSDFLGYGEGFQLLIIVIFSGLIMVAFNGNFSPLFSPPLKIPYAAIMLKLIYKQWVSPKIGGRQHGDTQDYLDGN